MNPKQLKLDFIQVYINERNKILLQLYPNDKTRLDYLNKQKTK